MEVYTAFYSPDRSAVRAMCQQILSMKTAMLDPVEKHHICFFGNGSDKCEGVLNHPNAHFVEGIDPSASSDDHSGTYTAINHHQFEDVAYFEPFYLKDFIATIPRKKVL